MKLDSYHLLLVLLGLIGLVAGGTIQCYNSKDVFLSEIAPCSSGYCYIDVFFHRVYKRGCVNTTVEDVSKNPCGEDIKSITSKENSTCYCNTDKCNGIIGEKERLCYVGMIGDCDYIFSLRGEVTAEHGERYGLGQKRCDGGRSGSQDETNMCRQTTVIYDTTKICNIYACKSDDIFDLPPASVTKNHFTLVYGGYDSVRSKWKKTFTNYGNKEMTVESNVCSGSLCNHELNASTTKSPVIPPLPPRLTTEMTIVNYNPTFKVSLFSILTLTLSIYIIDI